MLSFITQQVFQKRKVYEHAQLAMQMCIYAENIYDSNHGSICSPSCSNQTMNIVYIGTVKFY